MSTYRPSEPPAWQPGYDELGYPPEEPRYGEAPPPYDAVGAPYGATDAPYDATDAAYDDLEDVDEDGEALYERPEPNGGVAAAVIAAGVGCATLGLLVVAAAASPQVSQLLNFYSPAGPLSGKAIVSTVVYLVAWPNLHYRLRDKQVDLYKAFMVTIVLVALGIVGTFPPVYQLFGRR